MLAPLLLMKRLACFRKLCRSIAEEINDSGAPALVHNSMVIAAPPLLDHLRVRSLYFCYEYPRHLYEKGCITRTGSRLGDLLLGPLEREERRSDFASMKCAQRVATFSPYMQRRLMEIYDVNSDAVFPGVDSTCFTPEAEWSPGKHLLSVGALWPFKGHDTAIRAAALLPGAARQPLCIVADREFPGYGARLERLAAGLGVEIRICRGVDDTELLRLYREASAVLCLQRNEPYGLVPLEAMACARPVLARNSGGLPDNVAHGENGLLVGDSAPEAAESLLSVLSNPALAKGLGAAGRAFVLAHRTVEGCAERLSALLPI